MLNFPVSPTVGLIYNYNGVSWEWDGFGWAVSQPTFTNLYAPNLSTPQRNAIISPQPGQIVFDTTINNLCFYNGSQWRQVTTSAAP
jgi:hypothetical protein